MECQEQPIRSSEFRSRSGNIRRWMAYVKYDENGRIVWEEMSDDISAIVLRGGPTTVKRLKYGKNELEELRSCYGPYFRDRDLDERGITDFIYLVQYCLLTGTVIGCCLDTVTDMMRAKEAKNRKGKLHTKPTMLGNGYGVPVRTTGQVYPLSYERIKGFIAKECVEEVELSRIDLVGLVKMETPHQFGYRVFQQDGMLFARLELAQRHKGVLFECSRALYKGLANTGILGYKQIFQKSTMDVNERHLISCDFGVDLSGHAMLCMSYGSVGLLLSYFYDVMLNLRTNGTTLPIFVGERGKATYHTQTDYAFTLAYYAEAHGPLKLMKGHDLLLALLGSGQPHFYLDYNEAKEKLQRYERAQDSEVSTSKK